jgi:hypothetical protein
MKKRITDIVDFFLFQRGGKPLVPRAASRKAGKGLSEPSAKTSPPPPYGGGWTAAKSTSELALTGL